MIGCIFANTFNNDISQYRGLELKAKVNLENDKYVSKKICCSPSIRNNYKMETTRLHI